MAQAALIGAGAATLGGVIAGWLNMGLERIRIRSAREDARRDELRQTLTTFFVKDREWRVAWESLEKGEYKTQEDWIYPLAVGAREASYTMSLLVPDEVFNWWRDDYSPLREEFEKTAVAFAEEGKGTEVDRDAAAERLYAAIDRGRAISRRVLRPIAKRRLFGG